MKNSVPNCFIKTTFKKKVPNSARCKRDGQCHHAAPILISADEPFLTSQICPPTFENCTAVHVIHHVVCMCLRSFGHQGALYYVFLASDPLKTSREYAVFTLRTREPKVCTCKTSRQTQRVSAFLFWLRQMIALLHTSRGELAARTKFHNVSMNEKRKG